MMSSDDIITGVREDKVLGKTLLYNTEKLPNAATYNYLAFSCLHQGFP